MELVRRLGPTTPMLGVCLGHQAIGVAYGARVSRVEPVHGKRSPIRHAGAGPFAGLVDPLPAARYHSLAIERSSLPPELEVIAWAPDGTVMGIAHRSHPVVGLQFHPESILTDDGAALVGAFLSANARSARMSGTGGPPWRQPWSWRPRARPCPRPWPRRPWRS